MNEQLYARLLDCPEDNDAKNVYADWLEERGADELAYAYRYAAARRLRPLKYGVGYSWKWECQKRGASPQAHLLSWPLYAAMCKPKTVPRHLCFMTMDEAFEALSKGLALLEEARRA